MVVKYHEPIGGFFGQVGSSGVRGGVSKRGERQARGEAGERGGRAPGICRWCVMYVSSGQMAGGGTSLPVPDSHEPPPLCARLRALAARVLTWRCAPRPRGCAVWPVSAPPGGEEGPRGSSRTPHRGGGVRQPPDQGEEGGAGGARGACAGEGRGQQGAGGCIVDF